ARRLAGLQWTLGASDVVGAEALFALAAVDQRVGETGQVTGGLPHPGVHEDRAIDADDIIARLHHIAPPGVLDVALQLDADRTVIPAARQAAVDLAGLEGEPAALGQVHDLLHRHGGHVGEGIDLARVLAKANFGYVGGNDASPPRHQGILAR